MPEETSFAMMPYASLIKALGFLPKENATAIFRKTFANKYSIEVDFDQNRIDYGPLIGYGNKSTQNLSKAENWVVLECVNRLLEKGYLPKNIVLEKVYPTGHGTSGELDVLVNHDNGIPYLMIECKTYGKEFEKGSQRLRKDGGQLFTYFQQDKNAEILMLYASALSGNEVVYKHEIVKIEEDYRQTGNVRDFYDRWNKLPKNNGVFDSWVSPYDFQSKALTPESLKDIKQEDSSFIFNRFLEILRHNVVSDKPNAFNKIFTLFLCKIYDEKATRPQEELKFQWLEGKDTHINFQKRLTDLYKRGMKEFLEKDVTDLSDSEFEIKFQGVDESVRKQFLDQLTEIRLKKNNEFAIKEVFDDPSFIENAKVVKEVVELLQGYKIRYTKKQQYLSDFFELLLTTGLKQESGQFFTPVPIAQFIIKSLPVDRLVAEKLKNGEANNLLPTIIDYAAGSGHFVTESMHEIQRIIDRTDPSGFIDATARKIKTWKNDHFDWALQYVYGIEKDYRLVKVGKVGCYLHGDGLAKIVHSDGLASFADNDEYKDLLRKTDKEFPQDNKQFDICVSNPPYSVSAFRNNARKYYTEENFKIYDRLTDQSSEIECLFIERTKQLLKDGGIAGIILPASILSNTGIYTDARELILQYFNIVAIAELGSSTFMATNTNTVVLFLRRRSNFDALNIRQSVRRAIEEVRNVTINGVEESLSKYARSVWGLPFADYASLLKKEPNQEILSHDIFKGYLSKSSVKDESKRFEKIIEIESEKIFYFVLTYSQKVVVVKSGKKRKEKDFLGYEFSSRRGSEGIHPMKRGKAIDECTRLFDPESFDNPEKASTYIYQAFTGDFETPIDKSLAENISRHNLVDMFTFSRADFQKEISLVEKKTVEIATKWKLVKVSDLCLINPPKQELAGMDPELPISFIEMASVSEMGFIARSDVRILKDVTHGSYTYFRNNDIIIAKITPCMENGKCAIATDLVNGVAFGSSEFHVIRTDTDVALPKYIFYFLNTPDIRISAAQNMTGASGHRRVPSSFYEKLKIPLPPKDVQLKIVGEVEKLEQDSLQTEREIAASKNQIATIFEDLTFDQRDLGDIATFKNGLNYSRKSTGEVVKIVGVKDFQENLVPVLDILDDAQVDGELTDEYLLMPKDILVVRSNGSANLVGRFLYIEKLDARTSHSGFTIRIRPIATNIDPKFLCYFLRTDFVRNRMMNESGGANIKSLNQVLLSSIKVPLPSTSEQKKIIDEVEKIEGNINQLKIDLSSIANERKAVLTKYL